MRVERAVNKKKREHPDWGGIVAFNEAVYGRKFPKTEIRKAFKKLISTRDYDEDDLDDLMEGAIELTNKKTPKGDDFSQ